MQQDPSAIPSERTTAAPSHRTRLFLISILALATAGISANLRASISPILHDHYLSPLNPLTSDQMIGEILGVSFLGFAFTIAIGSALLDWLGMRTLLLLSSCCFIAGTGVIVSIDRLMATVPVYWALWLGMLLSGIGWGLVECVINPLVASLYTQDKTSRLNALHAWWPFGLIIGGVIGLSVVNASTPALSFWKIPYLSVILPSAAFGILVASTRFPVTERVASGVSTSGMFRELRRPMFLVWFGCMFLTAACELAPGQWVNLALSNTVKMRGIWITIYISALMYVMRHFAGAPARRLSPVGLLWVSSALAGIGLFTLSFATSPVSALLAATVWGSGVCYMWPTMLASASERFPRGGALLMGLMGTAGTLSIWFFLPKMGAIADTVKMDLSEGHAPGNPAFLLMHAIGDGVHAMLATVGIHGASAGVARSSPAYQDLLSRALHDPLAQQELTRIQNTAHAMSIEAMAVLPVLLVVVFGLIWITDVLRGGYQPAKP